jgi:hypothetical protein
MTGIGRMNTDFFVRFSLLGWMRMCGGLSVVQQLFFGSLCLHFLWNTDDADWADEYRFFCSLFSLRMDVDVRRFVCGSAAIFLAVANIGFVKNPSFY